jgi:predicted nuclease of predicted toxin-antitoxin system
MKLKLDENLDARLVPLLAAEGFDADSVRDEGLSGSHDEAVYDVCKSSERVLITLDLDFSNPLRFPPAETRGIVVVRPPRALLPVIQATLWSALAQLKTGSVDGKLWIVEPGRIRVYDPDEEPGTP